MIGQVSRTQLASIRLMSGQVSRGSAGEYQADERAGAEAEQRCRRTRGEKVLVSRIRLCNNKRPRRARRTGCTQGALWPWANSCLTDAAQVICCLAFLVLHTVSKKEYLKKESSYKESSCNVIYTWTEISSGWSNVNSG